MTAEHVSGDEPLIAMPALTLDALRQAVAAVMPSRLPEFFQEIQDAFSQAGDEDSVYPIRHFYQRWGATIAIERRPSVAARLHAAEHALADPDPGIRERAIRKQPRSSRRPTTRSRVAEWRWECITDDLLDGLPPDALRAVEQLGRELAVRESMVFLDGPAFTGEPPGLRTIQRGRRCSSTSPTSAANASSSSRSTGSDEAPGAAALIARRMPNPGSTSSTAWLTSRHQGEPFQAGQRVFALGRLALEQLVCLGQHQRVRAAEFPDLVADWQLGRADLAVDMLEARLGERPRDVDPSGSLDRSENCSRAWCDGRCTVLLFRAGSENAVQDRIWEQADAARRNRLRRSGASRQPDRIQPGTVRTPFAFEA